uniref:Putative serine protease n=1 Tax=Marma virus TaxID=2651926 RepID=A0A894KMM3_9LUTE|nr:MAG: putative serine protease [Marma virus]QRW42371.1 MAG: putative serine protease [Marma virus]QRW42375.1 MAG: putative serine protease [Marma virus]
MYKSVTAIMEDFMISEYALVIYVALLVFLSLTVTSVINPCTKSVLMVSFSAVFLLFARAVALVTSQYFYQGVQGIIHVIGSVKFWQAFRYETMSLNIVYTIVAFYVTVIVGLIIYYDCKRKEAKRHKYLTMKETGQYVGEKAMPNSNYEIVPILPAFQAAVLVSLDGITYKENGQCFWVDEGLLTASHVVEGYKYCCIYRDENHKFEAETSIFESGQGDYACCRDPVSITQKVGLAKGKLASVAVSKGAGYTVNIVARGKRTIGFLETHPQFGFVQYSGSTTYGFSGAPYHVGRTIFGMHLGADSINIGYDAAFLKTELRPSRVIRKLVDLKKEDSASWLVEQLGRQEEVQYWQSPFDPSEYKLRVGNMYHIVDGGVLQEILQRKKGRPTVNKIDYLGESSRNAAKEQTAREGKLDVPQVVPTPPEMKHEDPLIATIRGLVQEFGRTSVYTSTGLPSLEKESEKPVVKPSGSPPKPVAKPSGPPTIKESVEPVAGPSGLQPPVKEPEPVEEQGVKVDELPLAPRNAMTFEDSGNLLRAPAVPAGAPGMVSQPAPVQYYGQPIYGPMVYPFPPPSANYHMESRTSMPVPQNVALTNTQRNRARRENRQRKRNELELYKQRYGPIQPGGATSPPQPTQTPGSTVSSTEH